MARQDDPAPAGEAAATNEPAPEQRVGPIRQMLNDLHRALGGRKPQQPAAGDRVSDAADADAPFQLLPPSGHLFRDWFGLLPSLEEKGVTPSISFVTNLAGNPTGGLRQGFTHADNLDMDFVFDFEKILGLKGASFVVDMSQRSGSSLTRDYIGNVFNVQQVFGGSTFRLVDCAWQQQLFDDTAEFRVGRIAAGDDFLVSEYDYLFMQNAFDGNPVAVFFNSPGMTAYPNATWGFLGKVKLLDKRMYIMGGVYNGDPGIRANAYNGVNFSMNGPLFAMGEVGYCLNGQKGDGGLTGNYKVGFWYDNSVYTNFTTGTTTTGNWGFYGLFDQEVFALGDRSSQRGIGVFGSLLVSPNQSISTMPWFFTAGVAARGLFEARPEDVAGFGVVFGSFSNDLQAAQRQAQLLNPSVGVQTNETVLELTYRINLDHASVFIQPDIQYIFRPGGTGQIDNALVLGAQIGINF